MLEGYWPGFRHAINSSSPVLDNWINETFRRRYCRRLLLIKVYDGAHKTLPYLYQHRNKNVNIWRSKPAVAEHAHRFQPVNEIDWSFMQVIDQARKSRKERLGRLSKFRGGNRRSTMTQVSTAAKYGAPSCENKVHLKGLKHTPVTCFNSLT